MELDIGNTPYRNDVDVRSDVPSLSLEGMRWAKPGPRHRQHPMRSDITRHIALRGQSAAPEGPGPLLEYDLARERFQECLAQLF
ncbi:hypothetical protein MB02_03475 [Croceicoccus estronivorus]|nr:hypothetical protein MB02_03475 [Croceicoccus estronivorus]